MTTEQENAINQLRQDAEAAAEDAGGAIIPVGTDLATISPQSNQMIRLGEGLYPLSKTAKWPGTKYSRLVGVTGRTIIKATGQPSDYLNGAMFMLGHGTDHGRTVNRCFAGLIFDGNNVATDCMFGYVNVYGGGEVPSASDPYIDGLFIVDCEWKNLNCAMSLSGPGRGVPAAKRLCIMRSRYFGEGRAGPSPFYYEIGGTNLVYALIQEGQTSREVLRHHGQYPNLAGDALLVYQYCNISHRGGYAINGNKLDLQGTAGGQIHVRGCVLEAMHGIDGSNANNNRSQGELALIQVEDSFIDLMPNPGVTGWQPGHLFGVSALRKLVTKNSSYSGYSQVFWAQDGTLPETDMDAMTPAIPDGPDDDEPDEPDLPDEPELPAATRTKLHPVRTIEVFADDEGKEYEVVR